MRIDVSPGVREWMLSLADDKHLMGQQHAEWIGVTPFLEEDLAFCSIGQDELGHAALLYELLAGDDDAAIDALAYNRTADDYRSCHFVEVGTDDWAIAFVRHWMFDVADSHRWELVAKSSLPALRDLAARVAREERFHLLHAEQMLNVLLVDEPARAAIHAAATTMAPIAAGLFDPVAGETEAVDQGVVSAPFAGRYSAFRDEIEDRVGPLPWAQGVADQAARTKRSPDWQPLMDRMREVIDLDLSATW